MSNRTSSVVGRRWGLVVAVLIGAAGGGCPAQTQCPGGSCDIGVESTGLERTRAVGGLDNGGQVNAAEVRSTGDAGVSSQGVTDPVRAQVVTPDPSRAKPLTKKFQRSTPR
jgi:hypothetical protein